MKKLLLVLLFALPVFSFAQEYSEIVQVEEKSADQLYAAAREWFALTFNSANNVLQMDDPVAGILVGKGLFIENESYSVGKGITAVSTTMTWKIHFTMKVAVREGRYKCDINNVTVSVPSPVGTIENPFSLYTEKLEYFRNGSDPEWLKKNPPEGVKVNKMMLNATAKTNSVVYKMTVATDEQIENLMDSLKKSMNNTAEYDW